MRPKDTHPLNRFSLVGALIIGFRVITSFAAPATLLGIRTADAFLTVLPGFY